MNPLLDERSVRLRKILIKHEGIRLKPYVDTEGKTTIGVGRNLSDNGITQFEAMGMLSSDIDAALNEAHSKFPWFTSLSVPRQDAVIFLVFNLGMPRFQGFKKLHKALELANFELAGQELLDSRWASQVQRERVDDLYKLIVLGQYPLC